MKEDKTKKATPVTTPKSPEVKYRRKLEALSASLINDANTMIVPLLVKLESQYVSDGYASDFEEAFRMMMSHYTNINISAQRAATQFADDTNDVNKKRFYKSIESAIGIDLNSVVMGEDLSDILIGTIRENVALIKSIPDEYFKKIETIVYSGTISGDSSSSMIQQIRQLGYSTTKRARLIARDQTSKLNSNLTMQRSKNLGVEEYVWRTAQDDRVRESHKKKNGKVYRWDDPPKDTGHPGQDIQCRCVAQPIIKV